MGITPNTLSCACFWNCGLLNKAIRTERGTKREKVLLQGFIDTWEMI